MRLIDADALENDIRKIIHKRHGKRTVLALYMMLDIVRDRDTIKVRPAKHGKWLESESEYSESEIIFYCSECENRFIVQKGDRLDFNYCPNCGAKMDGGD